MSYALLSFVVLAAHLLFPDSHPPFFSSLQEQPTKQGRPLVTGKEAKETLDKTDLEVIQAVLAQEVTEKRLWLIDTTVVFDKYSIANMQETEGDRHKTLDSEGTAYKDLQRRIRVAVPLPKGLARGKVSLISMKKLDKEEPQGDGFFRKYPGSGVAHIALPGYNAKKTVAVVYFSHATSPLSGETCLIRLMKTGKTWKVMVKHILMLS